MIEFGIGRDAALALGVASAVAIGATAPATAHASESTAVVSRVGTQLVYRGTADAEAVSVSDEAGRLTVDVWGQAATAGEGCFVVVSAPLVTRFDCGDVLDDVEVDITLGAGSDVLSLSEVAFAGAVDGEDGDDVVRIGPSESGHSVDYAGGHGRDRVDYSTAAAAVRVSLDNVHGDGRIGLDDDDIGTDVENVWGSSEDDMIIGSPLGNDLQGGDGADEIFGRGGNDNLDAAGAGSTEPSLAYDQLSCGAGEDVARADNGSDRIADDCESSHP